MPDTPPYPGTPRWVKGFGIIALALILLFVAIHLSGRAPFHHNSAQGHGGHTSPGGP